MTVPRHDFYQTPTHVIVAVYAKGLAPEQTNVEFQPQKVVVTHPAQSFDMPLAATIDPAGSKARVLSTKLAKTGSEQWSSVLGIAPTPIGGPAKINAVRKNWDTLIDEEEPESSDPNAGGDSALQKLFSTIYKDANEDTKRAMIKSFTESGGTTLSTDWGTIGKERTAVRPPDGMEEKPY